MLTKLINLKRRNGKTTMLIHTAYVTGYPIIVDNTTKAHFIKEQATKMGLEGVQVYTFKEWQSFAGHSCYYNSGGENKVLIDEAQDLIEQALREFFKADVVAASLSLPMIELPTADKENKEVKDNADN